MQNTSLLHAGYQTPTTRSWHVERSVHRSNLVYPIFLTDDPTAIEDIEAMPEQKRYGVDRLVEAMRPLVERGLATVLLFGVPSKIQKVRLTLAWVQHNLLTWSLSVDIHSHPHTGSHGNPRR